MKNNLCDQCLAEGTLSVSGWGVKMVGSGKMHLCAEHLLAYDTKRPTEDQKFEVLVQAESFVIQAQRGDVANYRAAAKKAAMVKR